MKEIPILFSTPMVQAILDCRKTKTRRLNGLSKINENPSDYVFERMQEYPDSSYRAIFSDIGYDGEEGSVKCPYGKPGDRLWVREAVEIESCFLDGKKTITNLFYKTDSFAPKLTKWTSPRFMPKSACRIWLEVVSVRVERLQEITEQDAIAEGMNERYEKDADGLVEYDDRNTIAFEILWDRINKTNPDYFWSANPLVWVVEFKRINNNPNN